jgi:hypothetical protein
MPLPLLKGNEQLMPLPLLKGNVNPRLQHLLK